MNTIDVIVRKYDDLENQSFISIQPKESTRFQLFMQIVSGKSLEILSNISYRYIRRRDIQQKIFGPHVSRIRSAWLRCQK